MKKMLLTLLIMVLVPAAAMSQWTNLGGFPDNDRFDGVAMHGVAVDADGKVWITPFSASEPIVDPVSGDTLKDADGAVVNSNAIYVFNPDGTEADFSPIQFATIGEVTDTLGSNNRGLAADHNGDVLASYGSGTLYRFSHEDGSAMAKVVPQETSLTAAAVDDAGNVYTGLVLQNTGPMRIYDADFNFTSNAIDTTRGFSRAFAVTGDGNSVYWGGFTNNGVWKYTRPDEFSPYNAVPDTIFRGFHPESFTRMTGGNLVMGSRPGDDAGYTARTHYVIDPATDTFVDSLAWDDFGVELDANNKPRGIDMNNENTYAYAVVFDGVIGVPSVQYWRAGGVANENDNIIPDGFELAQNFPNPFNPTTNISFKMASASVATLKVYDTMGREVATLVNGNLAAGEHTAAFDASGLASGMYIYKLTAGGNTLTGKMMLLK